ncbi:malate synthase [Paramicrobacterium humi]|uniref:Malate synthase n=1 Tax=Paramicrobacterium humi TaxID=640635 RepID=A0A1H4J9G4_9MICO|nr:malate synthase A [Microbacterium humi]SEB42913.1 malate synthase [Microbacterium humi]
MTVTDQSASAASPPATVGRMRVAGPMHERFEEILTPEALRFLAELHDAFAGEREERLAARDRRREQFRQGADPDFRPETAHIREDPDWQVAGAGPGLLDRRVEITGPTDPKMTINALNSGAQVWLADQEDATSPTWRNVIGGQLSLLDAIRGRLSHTSADGKQYRVTAERQPTIVMRPRGWHLPEEHVRHTDQAGRERAASGSLVDFGLYAFHNAEPLMAGGTGPYFYLPKLESAEEAALWDAVFAFAERRLGLPHGTIRATVLIETLPAAFEMEEILYALRDHCAGLNAGRWDYIFSILKCFAGRDDTSVLPDRGEVSMTVPFMRAYTELLVQSCHKRGAHAIGGMSAFIPSRRDPGVTQNALRKVAEDKRREATDGFDGTWVAHPGLIPAAREQFDSVLGERPHQLHRRTAASITAQQLLDLRIDRPVTDAGVRGNVSVAVRYIASWLRGVGAAAIDDLMEDAATAEISRSQVWQWIRRGVRTEEGTPITRAQIDAELSRLLVDLPRADGDRLEDAAEIFRDVALGDDFPAFLTTGAYERHLVERS